jgi:hypothetical protein
LKGTVVATEMSGQAYRAEANGDGNFALLVPIGSYRVYGESPLFRGGAHCDNGQINVKVDTTLNIVCAAT